MLQKLIAYAIGQLLQMLKQEDIKDFIDAGLDKLEDKIDASPNKYDDALKPAITLVRNLLGIEDKKYGTDKE